MQRFDVWLKQAAAGMLMLVTCLALTASAQTNALYLDNGTLSHVGQQALTSLNFNVTTIVSANNLTNQLATGTWDIVVIEQYNSVIQTNPALALQDYVNNGGAVIINYWDMNGENNGGGGTTLTSAPILRATFGVQATVSFNDPQNVFVWQPAHAIFTTPYAITNLATNDVTYWIDNGDRMEPVPYSAQGLAGFTDTNRFEQTAIIEANFGRTFCNGFCFDNMDLTNGPKLLQNQIVSAIKPIVPWVYPSFGEFTDRIRVAWQSCGATQYEVLRSTNYAGLYTSLGVLPGTASNYDDTAVTLPGTYYYYMVNASNAFGSRGASLAQPGWRRSVENHAVGDYDGDGKADPAIYTQTNGELAVRLSGSGYYLVKTTLNGLGQPGDVMVSADYDGDGKADPAMYNVSTGEWRVMLSSAGYLLITTTLNDLGGWPFYSALGADYDGDQWADPVVYLETVGTWRFMLSGDNYLQYESQFGNIGGIGWSMDWADYDGDGLADPIVYQETTGVWTLLLSGSKYAPTITTFNGLGGLGFIPVIADYDGDGKADPAVFNPVTGEWRILMSANNYARVTVTLTF